MKVEFDSTLLSEMMSLWRDATDMKVKLSDEAKLHMLANRAQVLANMVAVADDWRIFLRACTAEGQDLSKLGAFSDEVTSFKQWATDRLNELKELGAGASLADKNEPPSDGGP